MADVTKEFHEAMDILNTNYYDIQNLERSISRCSRAKENYAEMRINLIWDENILNTYRHAEADILIEPALTEKLLCVMIDYYKEEKEEALNIVRTVLE